MTPPGGRGFVAAATIVALAGLSACTKKPPVPPTIETAITHPSPEEQLRRDIRGLVTDKAVDHAQWSVAAMSLRTGEVLYSLNAFRLQVPASNQKLLTTAVAAEALGWSFRYTTRVFGTGPITPEGTLEGDLVVVSDGDPTINPRHPQRWAAFDEWATQLAARGVRRVAGQLVGDDNAFAEPGWGMGWSWDDMPYGYSAPIGALQYNENQVEVMIGPGQAAGTRAIVSLSPPGSGLSIDHSVITAAAGEPTRISLDRIPGSSRLGVRGQIAVGARAITEYAAVQNPTQMYVNAFREALARHGIFIGGSAVDIDDLREPPVTAGATPLIEDRSPPLSEIIDVTLKWSRNGYAETLLRTLAPDRPATAEGGIEALRDTLKVWGLLPETYLARDGSGLSRYNWVSADALTWLLTYLYLNPDLGDQFRQALPVAGVSGAIEDRLKGTPVQGRVFAKTGSMSQIRSLSGYLTTRAGEPLVFSFIINGFRVPGRQIDEVVDRVLLRLVEFSR